MKKFLVYFGYLIAFLRLTLPYTAPVFIVFYFYSMSQDPSDDGFGSLMFFISFFVSIYWYLRLFEIYTGSNDKLKDGKYLTEFEWGCLANALCLLLGLFIVFKIALS